MSFNIQEMDLLHQNQAHEELDHNGRGLARSYDCVFCQRGFTTAQALGGHMNIHRKDRATNNDDDNNNNNKSINTNATNTKISTKSMVLEEDNQTNDSTATRLLYSSKSYFSSHHHNLGGNSSFEGRFNRFGSPSRTGPRIFGKRMQDHDRSQEGDELDLELRLGHYPW